MKKLSVRLALMALAVWVPVLLLDVLYVRTEHFRTENGVADFADVPDGLDMVNTGSSHGKYGFRYEAVPGVRGFNLAMESQPFLYDLAMLKEFSGHIRPGAVVLLSVSLESFHRHPGSMPQIRPRYYRLLSRGNNPEYNFGDALRHSILPVLGAGRNISAIWKDQPAQNGAFLDASLGSCTPDELERLARIRHKDIRVVVIDQAGEEVQENNVRLLENMIRTCRESGWVPVLVNMPFVRALDGQFGDAFKARFERRLETARAATGYPLLLDYSGDARFADSPELFADVDHLNVKGAALLTAQVAEDLRALGIPAGASRNGN